MLDEGSVSRGTKEENTAALSSTEAEYMAMTAAMKEAVVKTLTERNWIHEKISNQS
jgi:phosphopantetheinyl transferase (holo-ACP synthase)